MSSSTDKRKGGTNHAQRPTAASTNRQVHPASSSMPAPPPRAAMGSANAAEASHEAAAAASMADRKEDEKDKEKEASPPSTTNTATSTTNTSSTPRHRDRERETASPAALRAQLRQKEERIAYLEKEMDIMEREFQKELDKLSQNESETATFWQAKHSALNQQYLRTDTELRLLRSEIELRQSEREELTQGWEMLRRELKERDEEIRGLKGQVRGLKEFVSTSTRTDGQASDEIFAEGMARLGNGLQNWVITNFRKAKINLAKADEATLAELNELVPMYEELAKTAKVHLLQSVVSRILVQMIFEAYFVGLSPEQTNQFRQMEDMLLKLAGGSDEPVNQWRAATLSLLKRDPERLNFDTAGFAESIVARTNRVLGSVTDATGSEARDTALRVLVNNSIELARLMVVQKARLKVYMPEILPHQQVFFEADTMEDIGGEDEDSLDGREISCVVFPGVMKFGDENGQQMQFRNVICKARILCSQD